MASTKGLDEAYEDKQHQVNLTTSPLCHAIKMNLLLMSFPQAAYIFDPLGGSDDTTRPAKRRRVSRKADRLESHGIKNTTPYQPLLQGVESEQTRRLRQESFEKLWSVVDSRIQSILRDTNQTTLQQVTSFLQNAPDHTPQGKIPSAFIITGPNVASQDLLFEQLSETLHHEAGARVVRLRSGDASNLRAVLRKIIHVIASGASADGDELDLTTSKDVSSMILVIGPT